MIDDAQTILTIAFTMVMLLTPLVVAAGVRDRALHDRFVAMEKVMNEKIERVKDTAHDTAEEHAEQARDQFVRNRDFTDAVDRLERSQEEFRKDTRDQIKSIHDDIRGIMTAIARIETSAKKP